MSAHEYGDTMVEALRRANPVPVRETESRRAMPSAHALFADIIAQPPRRRPSRVRTRAIVIIVAIILLVLALVAFVAVRKETPTQPTSISCYAAASLDAPVIIISSTDDAERACAARWASGAFAKLGVKSRPSAGFDVCVLRGVASVFPGESGSVCPALHLPQSKRGVSDVAGFGKELDGRLIPVCVPFEGAERIVKNELEKWRLDGWTIKRGDRAWNATYPCSSFSIDAVAHVVTIVSIPDTRPPPT